MNPPSSIPVSFSGVEVQDAANNKVTDFSAHIPYATISPANAIGSLNQFDTGVSVETDYTVSYTTVNPMQPKATF